MMEYKNLRVKVIKIYRWIKNIEVKNFIFYFFSSLLYLLLSSIISKAFL